MKYEAFLAKIDRPLQWKLRKLTWTQNSMKVVKLSNISVKSGKNRFPMRIYVILMSEEKKSIHFCIKLLKCFILSHFKLHSIPLSFINDYQANFSFKNGNQPIHQPTEKVVNHVSYKHVHILSYMLIVNSPGAATLSINQSSPIKIRNLLRKLLTFLQVTATMLFLLFFNGISQNFNKTKLNFSIY